MLLEHPATAERLAWRICDTFLGEGDIAAAEIRLLASGLRQRDLDIGWAVGTVLRSRAFHEGRGQRGRVVGPVEFVVGAVRALELFEPAPSTLLLAEWATRLGEDLFYPPNVGGWPGGRSWISAGAMIGRTNYAAALAGGRDIGLPGPPDVLALTERHGFGRDFGAVTTIATGVLLGVDARTERYPSARRCTPIRSRKARRSTPYSEPGPVLTPSPEVLTPNDRATPFLGGPMFSRRSFLNRTLSSSSLIALSSTVPGFLARSARAAEPARDDRFLVVIELNGGNDGINTVVPYRDEGYQEHRSATRLATGDLIKIDDQVGLHPSMPDAARLLNDGKLAIVQGVGYPNPNRSHFESMRIWHTARPDASDAAGSGWIGRVLDGRAATSPSDPGAIFVGSYPSPVAVRGRRSLRSRWIGPMISSSEMARRAPPPA